MPDLTPHEVQALAAKHPRGKLLVWSRDGPSIRTMVGPYTLIVDQRPSNAGAWVLCGVSPSTDDIETDIHRCLNWIGMEVRRTAGQLGGRVFWGDDETTEAGE